MKYVHHPGTSQFFLCTGFLDNVKLSFRRVAIGRLSGKISGAGGGRNKAIMWEKPHSGQGAEECDATEA
ncbi:hypothetical protein [Foetidibacter luteolus]|uniref:hypothetical protein n=1 Tax=Foetidibacter luteolus TaxID=2608880 RepID=UPI00129B8606|nr:hypothetical protein [Foetidibacter luteolus]